MNTTTTQLDRRDFLKRSALAGTTAASLGLVTLAGQESASAATSCKWGALSLRAPDQITAIGALESKLGRKFETTHYRMPWTSDLVNKFTSWSATTGHTQILSWFARTKTSLISWRGIANGNQECAIRRKSQGAHGVRR